jgi:hypothetical protein
MLVPTIRSLRLCVYIFVVRIGLLAFCGWSFVITICYFDILILILFWLRITHCWCGEPQLGIFVMGAFPVFRLE